MYEELDHQVWTPVILRGKNPIKNVNNQTYNIIDKRNSDEIQKSNKCNQLENESENFHHQRVPISIAQEIIKTRCSMKMTQKEIAQKINVLQSVIASYENGSAIPDHKILQKISKVLNISFNTKMNKNKSKESFH